jgi:hypothetical protein
MKNGPLNENLASTENGVKQMYLHLPEHNDRATILMANLKASPRSDTVSIILNRMINHD